MISQSSSGSTARIVFGIAALIAWFGFVLNLILNIFDVYPSTNTNPNLLGFNEAGIAGLPGRVIDFLSYFTVWSNLLYAIVMTMLWYGSMRSTRINRTLRLDSLVMMTVTGIIYWMLLAADAQLQGLEYITNAIQHYINPVLAAVVFIIWGPRRWIKFGTIFAALIIPIIWAVYALVRGAVINAYPYPFLNVADRGLPAVLTTIAMIAVFGIVIGAIYGLIDWLMSRIQKPKPAVNESEPSRL